MYIAVSFASTYSLNTWMKLATELPFANPLLAISFPKFWANYQSSLALLFAAFNSIGDLVTQNTVS